jgi:uncharacterized membrane protein
MAEMEQQEKINLLAIFCYLGILVIIPILVGKKDEFVKFHIKQGLALLVAEVVTVVVGAIPVLGWIFGGLASILWLILSVLGIINVLTGKKKSLPLVGSYAEKFNI